MKEKIYSVSTYIDKTSLPSPFRFFKSIENAEKVANELNQKDSKIHYLVETFRLEDF